MCQFTSGGGVPHPRSRQGGTPSRSRQWGGVPHPRSRWGGTPSRSRQWGVPHPRSWGDPLPGAGGGYPIPGPGGGVPPSQVQAGEVPHPRSRQGGTRLGYPPTPGRSSIECICYAAVGMPLAFTQEDFLV